MVWECLMGNEVQVIGVYGMGGVGKTTMLNNINNRLLKQNNQFDKIVYVTVSKDASVTKLQNDIAEEVDLDLSKEHNEIRRSSLLFEELRRRGRILFILDDMWEAFPLLEIGIPNFIEHKGCKLVLTTRSLEVCRMMGCKSKIEVGLLSEDEAWELFIETVGVMLVPEVEKIAKGVVEECSCLPLAIVTVGGAMKGNDDIREWRVALNDLRESTNLIVDIEEKVIGRLKFSYNRLGGEVFKNCFLYCALYPEDYNISVEDLIDCWVMEGLIEGRSIADEVDRGHTILNKLKRCCMLEDTFSYGKKCLKMHDLIRDMALHITKTNPRFMVKAGIRSKEVGDEKEWKEDHMKVSFMASDIEEILISPKCPALVTLLLHRTTKLVRISNGFFVQMPGLRVLNLSGCYKITLLPASISDLVNLHVLDLNWCDRLKRVPSLEKLHLLRVLRLGGTSIEELPNGMEALVNLRRLDLRDTRILREIPAVVISRFSLLQELLLTSTPTNFVGVLLSLSRLEALSIGFECLSDFISYGRSHNFKQFHYFYLQVGQPFQSHGMPSTIRRKARVFGRLIEEIRFDRRKYQEIIDPLRKARFVSIKGNKERVCPENDLVLPQNTKRLYISELHELKSLVTCLKDVRELRRCEIRDCSEMEYMLSYSSEENWGVVLLEHLKTVEIHNCPKLIGLYNNNKGVALAAPPGTLSCLKELYIYDCDNLKYVFSSKLIKQLQNLVEVKIEDCREVEELIIIASEEEETSIDNNSIILPRFKKLILKKLPKLKSIWRGEMVCDSLQTVIVSWCHQLKRLPQFSGEDQSPPLALKEIKGGCKQWWDSLEWDGSFAKNLFQPLFHENEQEAEYYFDPAFGCHICGNLLYKPVVLPCGHIFCFWCVWEIMTGEEESHCWRCSCSFGYFPGICQLLHFLLLEMYPVVYNRRGEKVLEQERIKGERSPQLGNSLSRSSSHTYKEKNALAFPSTPPTICFAVENVGQYGVTCSNGGINPSTTLEQRSPDLVLYENTSTICGETHLGLESARTFTLEENNLNDGTCELVSVDDILCVVCKQLLLKPAVLNCGHAYCQSCLATLVDEADRCKLCRSLQPKGFLEVCQGLDYLLEKKFTKNYALRKQALQLQPIQGQQGNLSAGVEQDGNHSSQLSSWLGYQSLNVHIGVCCDDCGMFPIVGERYKCKDCDDGDGGFDICGECYKTPSKFPGRFFHQHTPEHTFEPIQLNL